MLYLKQMPDEWAEKVLNRIGQNIRKKRIANGWSFNRMEAETGIPRQTIFYWESGQRSPKIEYLLWLCKTTGWKLGELIGGSKNAVGTDSGNAGT